LALNGIARYQSRARTAGFLPAARAKRGRRAGRPEVVP
jgi:hypothetical protein